MGPLYDMALRFAVDNSALLGPDPQLKDLAVLAADRDRQGRLRKGDRRSLGALPGLSRTRTCARPRSPPSARPARARRGWPRTSTPSSRRRTASSAPGPSPNIPPSRPASTPSASLGDGSSFPVLFSAYVAGYSPALAAKAAAALGSIKGDYRGYLLRVITKNPPLEKSAAYAAGMANANFSDDDRGEIAEGAMAAALAATTQAASIRPWRCRPSASSGSPPRAQLRALKWQKASPLAIQHFRLVQADYAKGAASKTEFLEAIACLGAMGSTEAAQALALYLQLINAQTEQGSPFDEDILLATIGALGELGDKAAFDYLLQIGYLQYTEAVKRAAKDALLKLRW